VFGGEDETNMGLVRKTERKIIFNLLYYFSLIFTHLSLSIIFLQPNTIFSLPFYSQSTYFSILQQTEHKGYDDWNNVKIVYINIYEEYIKIKLKYFVLKIYYSHYLYSFSNFFITSKFKVFNQKIC